MRIRTSPYRGTLIAAALAAGARPAAAAAPAEAVAWRAAPPAARWYPAAVGFRPARDRATAPLTRRAGS